jgi:predicted transcriptional regulator
MPEANAGRRPSGELEASVLAALWAAGGRALTPADVQRELGTALARTTVTTILARLHEKGSVSRTRSGRGYAYLPVQDSPGLAARRMRTELDKSARDDRGTVLARFLSGLAPDDERLLRELLAQAGSPAENGTGGGTGRTGGGAGGSGGSGGSGRTGGGAGPVGGTAAGLEIEPGAGAEGEAV